MSLPDTDTQKQQPGIAQPSQGADTNLEDSMKVEPSPSPALVPPNDGITSTDVKLGVVTPGKSKVASSVHKNDAEEGGNTQRRSTRSKRRN